MPFYAFLCPTCDAGFEKLMRLGEAPPACPSCGGTGVERMVSRVAAPGKSCELIAGARRQAAKEGHFSNYSRAAKAKLKS